MSTTAHCDLEAARTQLRYVLLLGLRRSRYRLPSLVEISHVGPWRQKVTMLTETSRFGLMNHHQTFDLIAATRGTAISD